MKINAKIVLLALLPLLGGYAWAQPSIVVVVHKDSVVQSFSRTELIDLYMGRYTTLANHQAAQLIDQPEKSPIRQQFYRSLVNKSVAEVNAFWARLLFVGRSTPPTMLSDVKQIVAAVSEDKNGVAYLYERDLTDSLRVVYRLEANST